MDSKLYDNRYLLEHIVLPKNFYEHKINFIYVMIKSAGEFVYDVMKDIIENDGGTMPYSKEDYGIRFISLDDEAENGDYILVINYPAPEREPLCIRAICIFDLDTSANTGFEKYRFFTIERGMDNASLPMLCAWNEDGSHSNFGEVSDKLTEQIEAIKSMFQSKQEVNPDAE